ncbi:MAG: hypothetical protein ACXAEX_18860 [Promethearchaeota archaeon]
MVRGFLYTTIYIVITIVVPLVLFSLVTEISVSLGMVIRWEQQDYYNITFWLIAFGMIVSGLAFFKYSSPKQSIRKAVFAFIQLLVNCLYIWSYKFSGATELEFVITGYGYFSLDLSQMILIYLGIYFLTIVLKIYDIIDFTVNREKIRENRMKE